MKPQFLRCGRSLGIPRHDVCDRSLAQYVIRHAHYRDLEKTRMFKQNVLYVPATDPLAPTLQESFGTVNDVNESVRVNGCQVAGVQASVTEAARCLSFVSPIT